MNYIIYGGSFNPFHYGHLLSLLTTKTYFHNYRTIIFPSISNSKKLNNINNIDIENMLGALNFDKLGIEINNAFIRNNKVTYTIDILNYCKQNLEEDANLFLLLGEDSFKDLINWKEFKQILKLANIIVVNRDNTDIDEILDNLNIEKSNFYLLGNAKVNFDIKNSGQVFKIMYFKVNLASSKIRSLNNDDFFASVPSEIGKYILKNKLYIEHNYKYNQNNIYRLYSLPKLDSILRVANSYLGSNVSILEISQVNILFNYYVIINANSQSHILTLAKEMQNIAKLKKFKVVVEGEGSPWLVVDFGDILVHIMLEETRKYYALERLWG